MTKVIKERALVLKTVNHNMRAYNGFVWPKSGPVEAPDWEPADMCGNGLHGALWGQGDGLLFNFDPSAVWVVFEVEEYIDLDGKIKAPRGNVVFCGSRKDATDYIIKHGARGPVTGASITAWDKEEAIVGDYGNAIAGDYGTAIAGYKGKAIAGNCSEAITEDHGKAIAGHYGKAIAGDSGRATVGDGGKAITGDLGTAIAGYKGKAIAGNYGKAVAGDNGRATVGIGGEAIAGNGGEASAGAGSTISIERWDGYRYKNLIGYVGNGGLKPGVLYKVKNGKFVEVED